MAELKTVKDHSGSTMTDHVLSITDNDRIKIVVDGEYVTYLRCVNGTLSYLETEKITTI